MAWRTLACLLLGGLPLGTAPLLAQTCFPGAQRPRCGGFVVTELGYLHRVNAVPNAFGGSPQVHYLNSEAGYLLNQGQRTAVGLSAFVGALVDYDFTLRYGVKARGRYWLGPHTSLELGIGPVIGRFTEGSLPDQVQRTGVGLTSHLALNLGDRLILLTGLETLRDSDDPRPAWSVGARLGSRPAMWAGGLAGLVLGLGAVLWSS